MKIDTLILSGGGSFGICYNGVYQYLIEYNMLQEDFSNIKTIVGSSAGALFVIPFLLNYSFLEYKDIILSNKFDGTKLINNNDFSIDSLLQHNGFFSNDYIQEFIEYLLETKGYPKSLTLQQLFNMKPIRFCVRVFNITKNKEVIMDHETNPDIPITTLIKMTSCIPIIFKAIEYNKELYIDGCVQGEYTKILSPFFKDDYLFIHLLVERENEHSIDNFCNYTKTILNMCFTKLSNMVLYEKNERNITLPIKSSLDFFNFILPLETKIHLYRQAYNLIGDHFSKISQTHKDS